MFDIPCVILAGGKSSRMQEDKCFLSFKNTSLIKYQHNRLKQIFSKVYISSKTNKFDFSCDLILENSDIYSPLIALKQIITTIKEDKFFLITVDSPNISQKSIEHLINNSNNFDITIAKTPDNNIHNLCGVFSKKISNNIDNMLSDDNHKINYLINNVNFKTVFINKNEEFINLNTKEDYNNISQ